MFVLNIATKSPPNMKIQEFIRLIRPSIVHEILRLNIVHGYEECYDY